MEYKVVVKDNHSLTYKLIYQDNYQGVKINVNRENEIIVKAHSGMTFEYIESIVLKFFDKLYKYIENYKQLGVFSLTENFMFIFGERYELVVQKTTKRSKYEIYNNRIYLLINDESQKEAVIRRIYRDKARNYLIEHATLLAKKYHFNCVFKMKWYVGRWGQCESATRVITLATSLVAFEESVIDYVIFHELCHLKVPNHSTEFWKTLAEYYPDYKWAKKKLKFQC